MQSTIVPILEPSCIIRPGGVGQLSCGAWVASVLGRLRKALPYPSTLCPPAFGKGQYTRLARSVLIYSVHRAMEVERPERQALTYEPWVRFSYASRHSELWTPKLGSNSPTKDLMHYPVEVSRVLSQTAPSYQLAWDVFPCGYGRRADKRWSNS